MDTAMQTDLQTRKPPHRMGRGETERAGKRREREEREREREGERVRA